MSDRFPGEIRIGGTLRPADHESENIDEFLAQCSNQPIDWDGGSPDEPLALSTISKSIDPDTGWLTFRDTEACYGTFIKLEALCLKLDLSFDRISDASYDYDGELVRWRPDMAEPLCQLADRDGNSAIPGEYLKECLAMLDAGDAEGGAGALRALVPDIARLPKFTVDTSGA